jgi:hypothetical protein
MDKQADRTCELCGRPLGARVEKHHLVPRSRGGSETVNVHPICHRKIHSLLSERELAAEFATVSALRAHPEIARFVKWVARRPPDFHRRTERVRRRR